MLLPGDDASQIIRAVDWRCKFLRTKGLDQLIAFAMTVDKHPSWHDRQPLVRSVCLPLLARILKSCVAGALSDLKERAGGMQRLTNGGRAAPAPASTGPQLPLAPTLQLGDAAAMSLVDSVGSDDGELLGRKIAVAQDQAVDIDMGLMTKQLLSFLLQDIAAVDEEDRAAHTQALTDGEGRPIAPVLLPLEACARALVLHRSTRAGAHRHAHRHANGEKKRAHWHALRDGGPRRPVSARP